MTKHNAKENFFNSGRITYKSRQVSIEKCENVLIGLNFRRFWRNNSVCPNKSYYMWQPVAYRCFLVVFIAKNWIFFSWKRKMEQIIKFSRVSTEVQRWNWRNFKQHCFTNILWSYQLLDYLPKKHFFGSFNSSKSASANTFAECK